ncbi:MAG: HD domain-containing protein [Candidatus Gracilibacteria bacterium]|jgi:5'-deoxynucleotidase YfbR-like HD superfamily hydrolase
MDRKKIAKIYKEYHVPKNVINHMKKVAHICSILADKFIKKGAKIDKDLLLNAALLHDALRVCDIKNYNPCKIKKNPTKKDLRVWEALREKYGKIGHERAVTKILKEMGESKLANLILKHDFYLIDKLKTLEEKILYYADKRVDHDKIVTLKKRFKEGRKRNNKPGDNFKLIDSIEKKIFTLEKELKKGYL